MRFRTLPEAVEELRTKGYSVTRKKLLDGITDERYPYIQFDARYLLDMDVFLPVFEAEQSEPRIGVAELSDEIGLTHSTIYMLARTGVIPFVRHGIRYRFNLQEVKEALLQQMKVGSAGK